jgi:hypothetical protein
MPERQLPALRGPLEERAMKTMLRAAMVAAVLSAVALTGRSANAQEATGQMFYQNRDRTVSNLAGTYVPTAFDDRIEVWLGGGQGVMRFNVLNVEEITDTTITVPWSHYEVFNDQWHPKYGGKLVIDLTTIAPGTVYGWIRTKYAYNGFEWIEQDSEAWTPVAFTAP